MFTTIMQICLIIMAVSLLIALGAVILTKDELSRAVMADVIFYSMIAIFLVWTPVSYTYLTLPTNREV